jgi:predicted transcriptional regulator
MRTSILQGKSLSVKELSLTDPKTLQTIRALSSQTNLKILQLLSQEKLDISTIARRLKLSEPNISERIKQLENLQLVKISYAAGKRGIRKVCELAIEKLIVTIKP